MNKQRRAGYVKASQIQKQFWLLNQQAHSCAYNIASAFCCVGVDEKKLVKAVCDTVEAYTSLRVEFVIEAGELLQRQKVGQPWVCDTFEVNGNASDAVEVLVHQAAQRFDYANDPLVKIVVIHTGQPDTFYFLLVIPHIIIDLQTKRLLAQEIASRYRGNSAALSDDNYQDFSAFLESWRTEVAAEKYRREWGQRLHGVTRKVSAMDGQHDGYSEAKLLFSDELNVSLSRYCGENKTDMFIVLLAAYYWLLCRFSHSDNFAIGVPLSNRKQDRFKNTIGCFVNTVPIVPQTDSADFLSMVTACRRALLHGHRFQELPILDIISSLNQMNISEGESRALYNIGYTFEEPMALDLHEGACESIFLPGTGPQLDLFLRLYKKDGALCGRFEANNQFISPMLLQRFTESYLQLLQAVSASKPDSRPAYLPKADAQKITEFNHTEYDFGLGRHTTLTTHYSEQVLKTPDATALIDRGGSLSYSQFDQASNRLAQYLRVTGLSEGAVVAVCIERSIDMMIAIYGLLKAGMVYLPIDMEVPVERVNFMLKQAEAAAFLVNDETPHGLDESVSVIDIGSEPIKHMHCSTPATNIHIDSPAYIIFTSGSTGQPKGVLNNHRGILNRLCWGNNYFGVQPSDRILQKTPYSFDVSLWELFMPLSVGATLVLADHNSHKNPYEIARQIAQYNISMIHFVPAMLNAFLNTIDEQFESLHTILCSGEALTADLQSRTFACYPTIKLFNLYGPTEAAVEVSCWQCTHAQNKTIPIGRPIYNVMLYVVDEDMQQVPIGVMGELLIGGIQVAQGYVNNPELSNDRFVANPFAQGRVYRTGDFARWLENGAIEYVGRRDSQVKINGIRVELGEIENAALLHPAIDKVVVDYRKSETEKNLLLMYFTVLASAKAPVDAEQLQQYLAKSLPSYLLPHEYIQLDAFPISASGKIDRKSLPMPEATKTDRTMGRPVFNNAIEETIYDAWQCSLEAATFGLDEAFFDVGGDSFTLLEVFESLKDKFPDKLTSVDVFRFTTVRALANYLGDNQQDVREEAIDARAAKMKSALGTRKRYGKPR